MNDENIIKTYNEGINAIVVVVKTISSRIDFLNKNITGLNSEITGLNSEIAGQRDEIVTLNSIIQELKASNVRQEIRISELEARLNKNSNNSSKPPSQDGYGKAPKNSRQKSGRTTGGQLGHVGKTLEKVANPDEIIELKIETSCDCGCNLEEVENHPRTRQVFDIPEPKMWITEYVADSKVCPNCGKSHKSEFPTKVTQPTQYGKNMQAIINYLTMHQFIPLKRATEFIRDFTGQDISEGTLVNCIKTFCNTVSLSVESTKQAITQMTVVHFDESGMRTEGKTKWMHVASTPNLTYYEVNDKRGEKATHDIGILPNFQGTAVHDHWRPYYCFTDCTHAECNAHNLRYLKDIAENYHQQWATEMTGLLIEVHRRVNALKKTGCVAMSMKEINMWQNRYCHIIDKGILEDSGKSPKVLNKRGLPMKSKPLQLLYKLQQYDLETLAFMYDFEVPFDNNLAERDIRMQKLRQKISGCFRGANGASTFCKIRSYLSTAKKNGIGAMTAIANALAGQPYIPQV